MDLTREHEDLGAHRLTKDSFPSFYRMLMGLRFPLDVAEVIDLRDTINYAADTFKDPVRTPDYRQFVDALQAAIDSFGIENKHHSDRLINILTMLRHFHYLHSISSRDDDLRLRERQIANKQAYSKSVAYGFITFVTAALLGLVWLGTPAPGWGIKLTTLGLSYISLDYFRSLGTLSREYKLLTDDLNKVLRERVESLNWKTLIHKLSLLLGYKRVKGVNVFLMNDTSDFDSSSRTFH